MGCYNQYKARGCLYTECKSQHMLHTLALWGLVTNNGEGGGATNCRRGGGVSEVLPLQKKGGADFFFSHAEGGGAQKVVR